MYTSKSKVWHEHVRENKSFVLFKIWFWANTFSIKRKEFPYTAAIVSINRCFIREFKQRWRRCQRERHKSNWFRFRQNNNFARASRFFVHFFSLPSLHDYGEKLPNVTFFRGREHKTTFYFLFPEHWLSLLEFNSRKKLPTFDEMNEMEYAR